MQINVKPARPEQKPDQETLAAQLRAAQQNPSRPAAPQPQQSAPKPDPYQERMAKMEAAMMARQAQRPSAQPKPAEPAPQPAAQPRPVQPTMAQQRAAQADFSDILAKEAAAVKAEEAAKAAEVPAAAEAVKAPEAPKPVVTLDPRDLQETLKDFIGQTIRILTADHENASGRLEVVANGWIKLINVRSAGTEYYADEDIISIQHIVKVKTARTIDKDYYNQFMNR